jgi:hypothetical protein
LRTGSTEPICATFARRAVSNLGWAMPICASAPDLFRVRLRASDFGLLVLIRHDGDSGRARVRHPRGFHEGCPQDDGAEEARDKARLPETMRRPSLLARFVCVSHSNKGLCFDSVQNRQNECPTTLARQTHTRGARAVGAHRTRYHATVPFIGLHSITHVGLVQRTSFVSLWK